MPTFSIQTLLKKTLINKALVCVLLATFGTSAFACTLPKSYYKHVSCTSTAGVFLAVKDNGSPVALLDKKGNKTADLFAYDAVLSKQFYGGLMPVRQGKKIGYINKNGKVVIPLIYDSLGGTNWARAVRHGRIIVKKQGNWGVIDTNNRTILAFSSQIAHIGDFDEQGAWVQKGAVKYLIDSSGSTLHHTTTNVTTPTSPTTDTEVLWIDGVGRMDSPSSNHSTNQAISQTSPINYTPINSVMVEEPFFADQKDGKWGFVNAQGVPMIVYAFDEVRPFSLGLAAVRQGTHWGFIDKSGRLIIDFRFDDAGIIKDSTDSPHLPEPFVFKDGKAWIGNLNNGTKLCINTQGINVNCLP